MEAHKLCGCGGDPSALLILLTGLPAAGKSSFLSAVQHYVDAQQKHVFPLFGGDRRGRIAAILQLDEVLCTLPPSPRREAELGGVYPDNSMHSAVKEMVFTPDRWKRASQRLLHLTEVALRSCLSETQASAGSSIVTDKAAAVIPLIFVEDNMHLRSMRERFYRLCRRAEVAEEADGKAGEDGGLFVGMLELRFTVPLTVCVERNAQRGEAGSNPKTNTTFSPSCRVPTSVIVSMHALFDLCHDAPAKASAESSSNNAVAALSARWWRWTPSTQPWNLVELAAPTAETFDQSPPKPAELVADFFTHTLQEAARRACCAQRTHVKRQRERRRHIQAEDELARQQRSSACVRSHTHELDLQLRAVVHSFLQENQVYPPNDSSAAFRRAQAIGAELSQGKKKVMRRFKEESRALALERQPVSPTSARDEDAGYEKLTELHEACVLQFQQSLAALL